MSTLHRRFEGRARLDQLLALAGSASDTEDVAEAFAQAVQQDVPPQVVIEALFEDEPHFPSPKDAAALYGNLLGLYDAIAAGEDVDVGRGKGAQARPSRGQPARAPSLPPPGLYPKEGPSAEWLETAWRYIESAPKEVTKLEHAFENRQDALVTWLDESGADDQVYGAARQILFELFAMLELGAAAGVGRIDSTAFTGEAAGADVPVALAAWAQEAIFQAATDEEGPLATEDARQLDALVMKALKVLWDHALTGVKDGARKARR
jgi:hypothetical protein